MANVVSILSEIKTLSQYQQEQLLSYLEEYLLLGAQVSQVTKEVKEFRFSTGKICPHCGSGKVLRNGTSLCSHCH